MFKILKKLIISLRDMADLNKDITKEIDAEIINDLKQTYQKNKFLKIKIKVATVLEKLFEAKYISAEYTNSTEEDGIYGWIVSKKFEGMSALERRMQIETALKNSLTKEEQDQIRIIIAITPDENKAALANGKSYCEDIRDCMSQKIVEEIDEEIINNLKESVGHKPWSTLQNKMSEERQQRNAEAARITSQGLMDVFKFADKEVVDKLISIIDSVDVEKIKAIMNAFEVDKEGWIRVKIDLGLKKE